MTLLEWLDRMPPCMVRFLARKNNGHARMSTVDIQAASGLGPATISMLSNRLSWRRIRPETIDKFTKACGVNIFALKPQKHYLKRPNNKMRYIRRSTGHGRMLYIRIQRLLEQRNANARVQL